ncbi:PilZ domain protein [Hoeflea phototrophica DFL-43]|jgi:hypothetical protein|uniref:PilZ domain protein n=1 Tax=Hoeflea phototrophica (strain DSM 17068 / NCIMB 14078 / DFL-43) TaxID=411684 RepID=A9D423_HOEPD|nr:PilZ domain protein [Hoeflea phototrophica DFL-43]
MSERRSEIRYDANCAAIVEFTFLNKPSYVAATGKLVNISSSGCLFLSENMPWKNNDIVKIETKIFDLLSKRCMIYLPWINECFGGRVMRVGTVTAGVEFDEILPGSLVASIADLEPNQVRSFVPKCPWKYNRVLPLAQRAIINQRT